jgi:hypothetical protein
MEHAPLRYLSSAVAAQARRSRYSAVCFPGGRRPSRDLLRTHKLLLLFKASSRRFAPRSAALNTWPPWH